MKYMIHTCQKRLWYVEDFLIPSLKEQGIKQEDIILWNDAEMKGNLPSWLGACEYVRDNLADGRGIWHLQDDIVLGSKFREEAEKAGDMVINAWVCTRFNSKRYTMKGEVGVLYHWNSFQCIYIPTRYTTGFLSWYYREAIKDERCLDRIRENRWDDWLFWCYMRRKHKNEKCLNLAPNICEHIDYMIGGSVATPERQGNVVGVYWYENEILEKLWHDLKAYQEAKEKKATEQPVKTSRSRQKGVQTSKRVNTTGTRKKPVKTQNKGDNEE